jgi:hypothetical protein
MICFTTQGMEVWWANTDPTVRRNVQWLIVQVTEVYGGCSEYVERDCCEKFQITRHQFNWIVNHLRDKGVLDPATTHVVSANITVGELRAAQKLWNVPLGRNVSKADLLILYQESVWNTHT